jgi:hypothetical protein
MFESWSDAYTRGWPGLRKCFTHLCDHDWMCDLAFLIFQQMDEINIDVQVANNHNNETCDRITAFERKLQLRELHYDQII